MNDRLPGTTWDNPIIYRGHWHIARLIPIGKYDWGFAHEDWKDDHHDHRYGAGESLDDCQRQIDDMLCERCDGTGLLHGMLDDPCDECAGTGVTPNA